LCAAAAAADGRCDADGRFCDQFYLLGSISLLLIELIAADGVRRRLQISHAGLSTINASDSGFEYLEYFVDGIICPKESRCESPSMASRHFNIAMR
jgi:hypothetical protein